MSVLTGKSEKMEWDDIWTNLNQLLLDALTYFCSEDLDAAVAVGSGIMSSSDLQVQGSGVCLCIWTERIRSEKAGFQTVKPKSSTLAPELHREEVAIIGNI